MPTKIDHTDPSTLTLEGCWKAFELLAVPEHAPQVQREAMYQAFVAGCETVCGVYLSLDRHRPTGVKAGMRKWIEACQAEIKRMTGETRN